MSQYVVLPGDRAWLASLLKMEMRHDRSAGRRCVRHGDVPWLRREPGCEPCFRDLLAALEDTHRLFLQWRAWHRRLAEWLAQAEPFRRTR